MSKARPTRDCISLEEATVSNMWEIAAIVELLERKGLCTKPDPYDLIPESRSLLPVNTRSMWTTVRSDDGDRARRLMSMTLGPSSGIPFVMLRLSVLGDFEAHVVSGTIVGKHKGLPAGPP